MIRSLFRLLLPTALLTLAFLSMSYDLHRVILHGISGPCGARIYYDAYHGARHLWNRDNRRHRIAYHTVSGYRRFCKALEEAGFQVDVATSHGFDRATLDRYDIFFVGEQTYHARFMTETEQRELIRWVADGGALFAVVEHTNAHYMTDCFHKLFEGLPIKARLDSIADLGQSGPISPTWVDLPKAADHPVTRGVAEYRFYNGCSLETDAGVLFSAESSWSDRWDEGAPPIHNGNKAYDEGELRGPLAGVAAFEHGKGRIVVIADHNALANPNLYWGDHHRFGINSMAWLAGARINPHLYRLLAALAVIAACIVVLRRFRAPAMRIAGIALVLALAAGGAWHYAHPAPFDFFIHLGNASDMKYMTKEPGGFFTLYGQWTKEPQLRPWASRTLKAGYDALLLSSPHARFSEEDLGTIDDYLARGKNVVYMASLASLASPAGAQLAEKFGFATKLDRELGLKDKLTPFNVRGRERLIESIFRFYVPPDMPGLTVEGLEPVVHLTSGSYHIEDRRWEDATPRFHILSEKRAGNGRFMLFAPVELFDGNGLLHLYVDADVVQQQMAELGLRLAKYACGDESVVYVD
ncbi:MAG: hypothetical protein JXP34_07870 [Planctomycetes bacterium]|nr:hypothetical protein [Planctomycetota bacterium]